MSSYNICTPNTFTYIAGCRHVLGQDHEAWRMRSDHRESQLQQAKGQKYNEINRNHVFARKTRCLQVYKMFSSKPARTGKGHLGECSTKGHKIEGEEAENRWLQLMGVVDSGRVHPYPSDQVMTVKFMAISSIQCLRCLAAGEIAKTERGIAHCPFRSASQRFSECGPQTVSLWDPIVPICLQYVAMANVHPSKFCHRHWPSHLCKRGVLL